MENCNINNDEQLVNWMEDTLVNDYFLDLRPLFLEIFTSNSNNNNTPKSVLEPTQVVEGMQSPSGCFTSTVGKETGNNSSNVVTTFEISSSSRFLGLEKSGKTNYTAKRKGFESSSNDDYEDDLVAKRVCNGTRSRIQAEHVLAEQKRREKMRELFISLSKIVPGLKKLLDKATVIGDAINYMKELKERVKILEEEIKKRNSIGSSSFTNSSITRTFLKSTYNGMPSSQQNSAGLNNDIKVIITKNNILIKICCKKQKAIVSKIQHQMELVHLEVVNIEIMPFGDSMVDITILAKFPYKTSNMEQLNCNHPLLLRILQRLLQDTGGYSPTPTIDPMTCE